MPKKVPQLNPHNNDETQPLVESGPEVSKHVRMCSGGHLRSPAVGAQVAVTSKISAPEAQAEAALQAEQPPLRRGAPGLELEQLLGHAAARSVA